MPSMCTVLAVIRTAAAIGSITVAVFVPACAALPLVEPRPSADSASDSDATVDAVDVTPDHPHVASASCLDARVVRDGDHVFLGTPYPDDSQACPPYDTGGVGSFVAHVLPNETLRIAASTGLPHINYSAVVRLAASCLESACIRPPSFSYGSTPAVATYSNRTHDEQSIIVQIGPSNSMPTPDAPIFAEIAITRSTNTTCAAARPIDPMYEGSVQLHSEDVALSTTLAPSCAGEPFRALFYRTIVAGGEVLYVGATGVASRPSVEFFRSCADNACLPDTLFAQRDTRLERGYYNDTFDDQEVFFAVGFAEGAAELADVWVGWDDRF